MRDSPAELDIDDDFFDSFDDEHLLQGHLKHDNLGIDPAMKNYNNQRTTIRYIRNDIVVSINQVNIFGGHFLFSYRRPIMVELLDISSKGVLVSSPEKIRIDKKINLVLIFNGDKKFEIPSKIIREEVYAQKIYGIKFDHTRHDLGDHLLETQTELVFQDF